MKTKFVLIAISIFSFTFGEAWGVASFAQNVGINTTGNAPNSSALLDVNASPGNDKGILIPRLPLTATNSGTPISPLPGVGETGLMVYNTATAGVPPNDVVPGFYFWNGSAWAPLAGAGSSGAGGWTDDGTVVRLTASSDFVGIGTASPASTSALDITSTTKGILIPRMTTAQRDAITTPATGLQIYNTDCKVLNYWSGSCWIAMSKSLPDPGIITSTPATTVFCAGQVRTYSIPAVAGATSYVWSVPAGTSITSGNGTTSISATFGNISGDVCVKASNACETSGKTCLAVSVDPIPNTPGNITGITSINPGQQSVTYFVASVNGASTYTWSVPAGATIASGTGTTTIVVNFACNASSGNISVTANSTCGSSPASALALTITPFLAVNAGSGVFGGTSQTIGNAATGGTSAYTYAWSPATNLSSSTIATPIAQCTGSTTTYTVTATDSRSCTATSTVVVTRNLAVSAGAGVFGGTTQTIGNTATGGAGGYSYAWLPASNLSSYTIASPIAQCTGSTTTYTLTATDANSCTVNSSVVVTRNLTASAGANQALTCSNITIGGSPTATGGNATYSYSWSPSTGLSNSTAANPTVCPTTATNTYTVTVTDANACTATSSMTSTKSTCTVTYTYTGAVQSWTVPACVTSVTFDAYGAQGSTANSGAGGLGGRAQGSKAVTPGASIDVNVGGQAGFNGGGNGGCPGGTCGGKGGGASDVRIGGSALANRVIVAGGGGGGGAAGSWSGGAGGTGGGTTGGTGAASNGGGGPGGTGGTQTAGGNPGGGCGCCAGTAGALGVGGNGANSSSWSSGGAGGGGGGYYGGGAGHVCGSGEGGGGGSSYITGLTGGSTTAGVRAGNGQIIITY